MKQALVIGGTSGLGLELARLLSADHDVMITGSGRHKQAMAKQVTLELSEEVGLKSRIDECLKGLPPIDLLVYAAGFAQIGTITDLQEHDLQTMTTIGLVAPAILAQSILQKQDTLPQFVIISSTSARTPRLLEPMYAATKAGLEMLAKSLAQDIRFEQTLVIAPGGMKTSMWDGHPTDTSAFLDPAQVAKEVLPHLNDRYRYRIVAIPRTSGRAEIVEEQV